MRIINSLITIISIKLIKIIFRELYYIASKCRAQVLLK